MQKIVSVNQPGNTRIHICTFTHKCFNQQTDYKVMIPLDHSFSVDFLHFDSIWFFIFCLQIIMILDIHVQKAAAIIQITRHPMSTVLLVKKETKSKFPNFLGVCLKH